MENEFDTPLIIKARAFMIRKHAGQVRKYTGEPYHTHPEEVLAILRRYGYGSNELMSIVALLHDTVEDTDTTFQDLADDFGAEAANGVWWLTDPPLDVGNRAARKARARSRLSNAPFHLQTVKYADGMHNTQSIKAHDVNFWRVYRHEFQDLLAVMNGGDPTMYTDLSEMVK